MSQVVVCSSTTRTDASDSMTSASTTMNDTSHQRDGMFRTRRSARTRRWAGSNGGGEGASEVVSRAEESVTAMRGNRPCYPVLVDRPAEPRLRRNLARPPLDRFPQDVVAPRGEPVPGGQKG